MYLSIMGMYEYDPTVFSGFNVPEGIDKDAVIDEILLQCAELEIVYPDLNTMKLAIAVWSLGNQYTWNKLYETTKLVYNPIWNVDADISEIHSRESVSSGTSQNKETRNLTDTETRNLTDTETPNITNTRSVKGYNSNNWAEAEKNATTGTDTIQHTGTDTNQHTGTDTFDYTDSQRVNDDNTITTRRTGNIGVTTTQAMIKEERSIAEFNMISYITQSFKERFCILIY
jgi:hypothetical protein